MCFGHFAVLLMFNFKYPVEGMKEIVWLTLLKTGFKQQKWKSKWVIYCGFHAGNKNNL